MLIGYYDYIKEAKKEDFLVGGHVYCWKLKDFSYTNCVAEIKKVNDQSIDIQFDKSVFDEKNNTWTRITTIDENQLGKLVHIKPADLKKFRTESLVPYESSKKFKFFMKEIGFKRSLDYSDISFFDIDKDSDENVSFVTAQKYKQNHFEDMYISKIRQTMRVGRFFKKLNPELKDSEVEKMVHEYKATWRIVMEKAKNGLKVVTGEDIRYWYLNKNYSEKSGSGTLHQSCMKYKKSQKRFDIYCENPDKIAMAILLDENEKLLARALIWKLDTPEGYIYMDRIYFVDMTCKSIIFNYGKENKMIMYDDIKNIPSKMEINLEKDYGDDKKNPYMDTFKYFYKKNNTLSNILESNYKYCYVDND